MFEKFARPILDEFENWLSSGYLAWARNHKIELRFGAEHHPITREWGRGFWLKKGKTRLFIWRPMLEDVGFFGPRIWMKQENNIICVPYTLGKYEDALTDLIRQL